MTRKLLIAAVLAALVTPSAGCSGAPFRDSAWDLTEGPLKAISGEYYFGDGLGVNCTIELRPANRFRFEWTGCLGTYGDNYGPAQIEDGRLFLSPRKSNPEGFGGTPCEFVVVSWGTRTYLVPPGEMQDFCQAVIAGTEPRTELWGRFYLREEDLAEKPTGLPEVPEPWRAMLSPK